MISATGLDFGPMYKAEVRARKGQVKPKSAEALPALEGEELVPKDNIPLRAFNAFVPIIVMVVALGVSLVLLGEGETLTKILESTEPYRSSSDLVWNDYPRSSVVVVGCYGGTQHSLIPGNPAGRLLARRAYSGHCFHFGCHYRVYDRNQLGNDGHSDATGHTVGLGGHDGIRCC